MAEDMQSGGLIDSLERFQMFELAHAAHFAFLDESNNLMMRDYKRYGVLEGRYIYTETGQTLTLVEQSRQINGVRFQRLTDEDQYRALIDASAVALDQGDLKFYVSLWERHTTRYLSDAFIALMGSQCATIVRTATAEALSKTLSAEQASPANEARRKHCCRPRSIS
ncbi:hypothetical protein [Pseudomonas coronafaciens]|nr:hypothetical protein [Pseudomonas coronafaciens]MCQ3014802.1 hypothetical protein [Pseudomonas tremae]